MDRTGKSHISNLRFFGWLVAMCTIVLLTAISAANAADPEPTRRVLMISTGGRLGPGFTLIEQSALDRLRQLSPRPIDFYFESLDIVRFPSESYHRLFRGYLYEKYNDYPPNLVILFYVGKLTVAQNLLGQLFPSIPVVVAGLTEEDVPLDQLGKRISGLAQRADVRGTIKLLLRLHPATRAASWSSAAPRTSIVTSWVERATPRVRLMDASSSISGQTVLWPNCVKR